MDSKFIILICIGFLAKHKYILVNALSDVELHIDNIMSKIEKLEDYCEKKSESEIPVLILNNPDERSKTFCNRRVGISNSFYCELIKENRIKYVEENNIVINESCKELKERGETKSGVYEIQPELSPKPFMIFCDMKVRDGGWVVIQNRVDGSEDFYREWRDYKFGFGDLHSEYWIGLENIYLLTNPKSVELLIELTDRDDKTYFAYYKEFQVGLLEDGYPLKVIQGYTGDAGDALINVHSGCKFSAWDYDLDENPDRNCAVENLGAWWYNGRDDTPCLESNLNAKFSNIIPCEAEKDLARCIYWLSPKFDKVQCFSRSRMLIRSA